jgi:hypothetical protein
MAPSGANWYVPDFVWFFLARSGDFQNWIPEQKPLPSA